MHVHVSKMRSWNYNNPKYFLLSLTSSSFIIVHNWFLIIFFIFGSGVSSCLSPLVLHFVFCVPRLGFFVSLYNNLTSTLIMNPKRMYVNLFFDLLNCLTNNLL